MQMNNIIYNKEELYKPILAGICIKFALLMLSEFIIIGFIIIGFIIFKIRSISLNFLLYIYHHANMFLRISP